MNTKVNWLKSLLPWRREEAAEWTPASNWQQLVAGTTGETILAPAASSLFAVACGITRASGRKTIAADVLWVAACGLRRFFPGKKHAHSEDFQSELDELMEFLQSQVANPDMLFDRMLQVLELKIPNESLVLSAWICDKDAFTPKVILCVPPGKVDSKTVRSAFGLEPVVVQTWSHARTLNELQHHITSVNLVTALIEKAGPEVTTALHRCGFAPPRRVAARSDSRSDDAVAIDVEKVRALVNKGAMFHDAQRYEEAIQCYDAALAINPREAFAWHNKSNSLGVLGRIEEALVCIEKSLAIDATNSKAWNSKGLALESLGKTEQAMECYDKASELSPRDLNIWSNKARFLRAQDRRDEALGCLDRAIQIDLGQAKASGLVELRQQIQMGLDVVRLLVAEKHAQAENSPGFTRSKLFTGAPESIRVGMLITSACDATLKWEESKGCWQAETYVCIPGEEKIFGISIGARIWPQGNGYRCYARTSYLSSAADWADSVKTLELAKAETAKMMASCAFQLFAGVRGAQETGGE